MNQALYSPNREFSFTREQFQFLAGLANRKTGIVLPEQKKDMVYGRLVRRLRALGLDDFSDYCDLLQSDEGSEEMPHLVNAITTNLTSFFREAHHFEHLAQQAAKWKNEGQKRLRIWSAACSSGMEPYSIAMTLRTALPDIDRLDAKVLATDIDSNMVATATAGEYNGSDLGQIAEAYKAYIERHGINGRVRMNESLKRLITFRTLNLLDAWPMKGPFDAVFCRNVVIYFDKETKQRLFNRIADILTPDGWLYIGHSENLHGISDRFELVGRTIYRRVK
jgi:chemotaxis protein methyltransferase CheR